VALLARLAATLTPVGALAGALVFGLGAFARPLAQRVARRLSAGDAARGALWEARAWPLPLLLVAAAPLALVGHLLFSGGKMSRLPARSALELVAIAVLLTGAYVALRVGRALVPRVLRLEGRARWVHHGFLVSTVSNALTRSAGVRYRPRDARGAQQRER
jgi:hypothetical protein